MNRWTSHWCVLLMIAGTAIASSQEPVALRLETALGLARQSSNALKISDARVAAASARSAEAGAARLPSFTLEASYRRVSEIDPFRVSVPFFPVPVEISPVVLNNYAARATVSQPLFTGLRLSNLDRAAELQSVAAEADRNTDAADLAMTVITAYWSCYQTRQVRQAVDENVTRLQAYEGDVRKFLEKGMATRNDLLRVQVQLANARLSAIDAENDMRLADMNLNTLVGFDPDTRLELASDPAEYGGQSTTARGSSTDSLVRKAIASRTEIQSLETRREAAKASALAAAGRWWPQIFLQGNYYYSRPNPRILPTKDEWKGTWDLGVVVQFDLWNWGMTAHQVNQAEALVRQTEAQLAQIHDNIRLEVKRAALLVERSAARVDVAVVARDQAEENLRVMQDRFKSGLSTSTDLLDADLLVVQARTSYAGALVERLVAQARLERALGGGIR